MRHTTIDGQNQNHDLKVGSIFGTGRSGSTWLGAMVSSHPEVAYRFEPFHRLGATQPAVEEALETIRSDKFSHQDLSTVYQALLPAYPQAEKPPFFPKNYGMKLPLGRKLTWPLARKNGEVEKLFSYLYMPKGNPTLIFKEVDLADVLSKLLNCTQVPTVYILRHPCGVISSLLRGQKNNLMPTGRRSVLLNLLEQHQPDLAEKYQTCLPQMDVSEQEALLWLIDVEQAIKVCQGNSNALIVVYEQLVEQPLEMLQKIFNHFGLAMTSQSVKFIEQSTKSSVTSKTKRGEIGINKYFSVFRDSLSSRDRWKEELSPEKVDKIMQIIQDSNSQGYALGAATGLWN